MSVRRIGHALASAATFLIFAAVAWGGQTPVEVLRVTTPSGVPFGIVGGMGPKRAPTFIMFAKTIAKTLQDSEFNQFGMRLRQKTGCRIVTLDLPAHGADRRPGEPSNGLGGWALRYKAGEDVVGPFLAKVTAVLDYLIAQGATDPARVGACGISRGGFLALRFTAADPRVKWCVALAPVTDLLALDEFRGMQGNTLARSQQLGRFASRLAGRAIWITIGNDDERVGTDRAIAFSRRVVEEALAQGKFPDIELRVSTAQGHADTLEDVPLAVAWAAPRFQPLP